MNGASFHLTRAIVNLFQLGVRGAMIARRIEEYPLQRVAGIIVAGGEGKRLGGQKPFQDFGQGVLLDAVIARVHPQVGTLALNVLPAHAELYRARCSSALPLLFDPFESNCGPLGGVLAGLEWLEKLHAFDWLATFPGDTPFLPKDLVSQLLAASHPGTPMMAKVGERTHGLCALWPKGSSVRLRNDVASGALRSMSSALQALGGQLCEIACGEDAFMNINTREDLARARAMLANAP
jgi:molybdenum cofactor guanylyltransferase